ncbi:hypothetical protein BD410DRAFT_893269 [Rickenella mellea]|uniref:F-box domain-containing protein n=1 Tax=Rickenella mellea TaxID=50990 RepID=A0A4R5XHI9_9AGAM|nr:hypothetical protein BD410DRAFT_893269 [Rickenella mellea]
MQKVESKISFHQMTCSKLSLRRGLELLPDEILAEIFEMGYTPDLDGRRFAITISHVNRRFWNISLQLSRLWSTSSNYQGISELEDFLSRSKQAGLSVRIYRLEEQRPPMTPADIFVPLVLHLPILRSLIDNSWCLPTNLSMWNLPNLVNYEGNLMLDFLATTLVSCTLDLLEGPEYEGLDGLLIFVSNNSNLQYLTVNFHDFVPYSRRVSQENASSTTISYGLWII